MCSNHLLHLSKITQQLTSYSQNKLNFIIMVFLGQNKIIFLKIMKKNFSKMMCSKTHIRYLQ